MINEKKKKKTTKHIIKNLPGAQMTLSLFVPVCIGLKRGGRGSGGGVKSGGRWSNEVALLMMWLCAL